MMNIAMAPSRANSTTKYFSSLLVVAIIVLHNNNDVTTVSAKPTFSHSSSSTLSHRNSMHQPLSLSSRLQLPTILNSIPRGGSTRTYDSTDDEDEEELDEIEDDDEEEQERKRQEKEEQKLKIQSYKLQQQHLLQLRSTFLSEALAARGISVGPTMVDVITPEGTKPPQETDWDCSMSTLDDPKSCLYSFDAEPNTKVISPIGTTLYISLSALNRLRRNDPSKVEPMWHSQYSILKSWFDDESPYSLLQYVGFKGFLISTLLLDIGNGVLLSSLLLSSILAVLIVCMPLVDFLIGRMLVSTTMWMKWQSWGRFVHAALPLKLLIGQMAWKFVAGSFGKLEGMVKDFVVELECSILEDCIPVTVGLENELEHDDDEEEEVDLEMEGIGMSGDDDIDEDDNTDDDFDVTEDEEDDIDDDTDDDTDDDSDEDDTDSDSDAW